MSKKIRAALEPLAPILLENDDKLHKDISGLYGD